MKCALFLAAAISLLTPAAYADGALQGRIEHRHSLQRLGRPAMPSRPLGEPLEQASNGKHKSTFKLTSSNVSNLLDKGSFDFNAKQNGGVDESNKESESVIAWEQWHQNLSKIIYHHWLTYSNIPGEGVVTLTVTRDGDVNFDLSNFHVQPSEQIANDQKELFERCLGRTLNMIAHTDELAFPQGSQRKNVTLTCNFKHSLSDDVHQGYDWKRNDYERVRNPR